MNIRHPYTRCDLSVIRDCSEIPACRGLEVLAILVEVDPIADGEEKKYPERVEKFSRNYIWRKITGDITIEFIDAAVERMFNAQEVTDEVEPAKLRELQQRIVNLFLTRYDTAMNDGLTTVADAIHETATAGLPPRQQRL